METVATFSGTIVDSTVYTNSLYCLTQTDGRAEVHRLCLDAGTILLLAAVDFKAADTSWLLCINGFHLSEEFFTQLMGRESEQLSSQLYIIGIGT